MLVAQHPYLWEARLLGSRPAYPSVDRKRWPACCSLGAHLAGMPYLGIAVCFALSTYGVVTLLFRPLKALQIELRFP